MRRIYWLPLIGGGLLLVRRFGFPKMRTRAGEMCDRMFEGMPESFPPKRLFMNVEAIREQNDRLLELLEADREAKPAEKAEAAV